MWRIAQTGPDADRDIKFKGDFERSAGWFSAAVEGRQVALLTKDFWQKCPKEVKISPQELVYYQWPKHGELAPPDPEATRLENIYHFECYHRGDRLHAQLPDEYYEVFKEQKDSTECKAEFARAANFQGASMRNEFALVIVPASGEAGGTDGYLDKLQQLYLQNPTARVSPRSVARSGVLGPAATAGRELAEWEQAVVRGTLGYAHSIARWNDYGWAIYGNTHHEELMNPDVAEVPAGRPSLHRVWNNNHYQQGSTCWHLWGLNGDARLLQAARTFTDNYASIGQVRYDKKFAQSDPEQQPAAERQVSFPRRLLPLQGVCAVGRSRLWHGNAGR